MLGVVKDHLESNLNDDVDDDEVNSGLAKFSATNELYEACVLHTHSQT